MSLKSTLVINILFVTSFMAYSQSNNTSSQKGLEWSVYDSIQSYYQKGRWLDVINLYEDEVVSGNVEVYLDHSYFIALSRSYEELSRLDSINSDEYMVSSQKLYNQGLAISGEYLMENAYGYLIYDKVDQYPEPKGGIGRFYEMIKENMVYPKSARRSKIDGRVFLQFIVSNSGELVDIKVIKGLSPELDAEAIRLVKLSGNWNPPVHRNQPSYCRMILPITFSL